MGNQEDIESLKVQLRQKTEELETALAELKVKEQQLIEQEKLAFKGRLTAGFCHEFKNPLALLKHGFATVIDNLGEELPEEKKRVLIIQLLKDLQEPINKLDFLFKLILTSPSSKRLALLSASPNVFVSSIIESAFKFRVSASCGSIDPKCHFDPQLNQQRKIPQQLEIPLFNLIENAIDALSQREKQESHYQPSMEIRTHWGKDNWIITVQDNGGGIAPEIADKLFEPFITSKADTDGLGLGLYISQEVMDRIGGQILLDTFGQSTKFTLIVPFG